MLSTIAASAGRPGKNWKPHLKTGTLQSSLLHSTNKQHLPICWKRWQVRNLIPAEKTCPSPCFEKFTFVLGSVAQGRASDQSPPTECAIQKKDDGMKKSRINWDKEHKEPTALPGFMYPKGTQNVLCFIYQPQHQWCVFLESWLLAYIRANQFLPEEHLILNHSLSMATNTFYCSTWNHSLVQEDTFLSLSYGTSLVPICSFSTAGCLTPFVNLTKQWIFLCPHSSRGRRTDICSMWLFTAVTITVVRPVPVLKSQFLTHKLEEQACKVKPALQMGSVNIH